MVNRLMVLTDRTQAKRPLVDVVGAAVAGGARLFVMREKDLPADERAALARQLHEVILPAGGQLLLAGCEPGPDGVHLAAADPAPANRPAGLVGRSCHNAAELGRATAEGVDYATLSPVYESASKPGYGPALGIEGLRMLCGGALPVYALGGVDTAERAARCVGAGAAGVAVMGAVMRASDPAGLVAGLLDALGVRT